MAIRAASLTLIALLTLLLGPLFAARHATAAESEPVASKRSTATLITATDRAAAGEPFGAALRLRLAPGWHTYWQNPGDAGVPPDIQVTLPPGSQVSPIEWPAPERVAEGSLTTYAYSGDVVLPFAITPGSGDQTIRAHAEWLTCRDVCVPEEAEFELVVPSGPPAPAPQAALIEAALARVPKPADFAATLASDGTLAVRGESLPAELVRADFFPLRAGAVEHVAAQAPVRDGGYLRIKLDPPDASGPADGILSLTSRAGLRYAYSVSPKLAPVSASSTALPPLLLLGLGGGLLLNLMPCVFPILAMKAMTLARLSGAEMRRVRQESLSYTAGVVAAFTALGAALVALRAAGVASGWGFQFQSAAFVTAIAWLLFAIGLNLSGVYVVGAALAGRGNDLARRGGHVGSFFTGVLAVVVASPCTAPFMGTAITGALALSSASALAVFVSLGLGLALPYAAVALIPGVARLLPRPGEWMRLLQQALAFPMYAAAVWLVWVVSQQTGAAGVLTAGIGLVVVGFGAWALGLAGHAGRVGRRVGHGMAFAAALGLAALLSTSGPGQPPSASLEPFTTARLEQLRTEGRPVFVNMTAAWCLSCLVNERIALSVPAVQRAFAHADVAYLKGDWTRQDPSISSYLAQLGRDGVPLYVLYPPGKPPVVLPQLLSEGIVLDQLAKLKS